MSKSTREADFRKVDVDELDEENFKDEETQEEGSQDQFSQQESEIKSLLTSYPLTTSTRITCSVCVILCIAMIM